MQSEWSSIRIKKGPGGCGDVTDTKKNDIISRAVVVWGRMGLTDEQIAFGVATMNVEAGFNAKAENPNTKAYGLGQFLKGTWNDAVNYYNKRHEPDIDSKKGKTDESSQILVMGEWIKYVWNKTSVIKDHERLRNFGCEEIAYGLWHEGQNAGLSKIAAYLNGNYKAVHGFFDETYTEALYILSPSQGPAPSF